jgi:phage terminase large subunit GpA-like protein
MVAINAEGRLAAAACRGLRPEPILTVSQWAAKNRLMTSKGGVTVGRWNNDLTPYLVEVMDCLSARSLVQKVVFMKSSQIGATEAGNNWLGYIIDQAPGPTLLIMPTKLLMRDSSRQKIGPMLEGTPCLSEKLARRRSKDAANTAYTKEFPGGLLKMGGANSASGFSSFSARNLFLDEVDRYPHNVQGEGDPIFLAERRAGGFGTKWKMYLVSTPTIKGHSRIEREFEKSDQRYYMVPCPDCGHKQRLVWGNLRYELDEHKECKWVAYSCSACGVLIPEAKKAAMLSAGEWVATKPGRKIRGYHINALYSPTQMFSWAQVVMAFGSSRGNSELLKVFVNTILGESWQDIGEAPDWEKLRDRAEEYQIGTCPEGVCVLTASVDVQKDRLEYMVLGWGPGHENWLIDYQVLPGDPESAETWKGIESLLMQDFPKAGGGSLMIRRMAVDSGNWAQTVYNFVRRQDAARVFAVKGYDKLRMVLAPPKAVDVHQSGKAVKYRGAKVWTVGTDHCKGEFYGWLRQPLPVDPSEPKPHGFSHWPKGLPEEFFRQLCAEQRVEVKKKNGVLKYEWRTIRERNEALDCQVYARAALYSLGAHRWAPERWQEEAGVGTFAMATAPKAAARKRVRPRRGEGFLGRFQPEHGNE